jgi:transposase
MDTMGNDDRRGKDALEAQRRPLRRMRPVAEKRRIVEETLKPGASVALIARRHEVNANLVFGWRRLYQQGLLEEPGALAVPMLPVRLSMHKPIASQRRRRGKSGQDTRAVAAAAGCIEIEFTSGERVRVHGRVEREALWQVIEALLRR